MRTYTPNFLLNVVEDEFGWEVRRQMENLEQRNWVIFLNTLEDETGQNTRHLVDCVEQLEG